MPSDPRFPDFWDDEYRRLWENYSPTAMRIYLEGAQSGASLLPRGVDLLVNWDVFNQDAIDWMKKYGLNWLHGINETTQKATIRAIDDWVRSGEPLPNLSARLSQFFGRERAERIAITEVTRIYSEGNLAAWKSTGFVSGKRWNTAMDDRVCPICRPLDGRIVRSDYYFPAIMAGGLWAPPAHVRCRCWITPVLDESAFREVVAREIAR
jgi:SPP1 gp7 family putative phage head morphogenesis protein